MSAVFSKVRQAVVGLQTVWSIIGLTLLVVLLCEGGLRLTVYVKDTWIDKPATGTVDRRVAADGYGEAAWTAAYYEEFREAWPMVWQSYVYWRREPYSGQFINVNEDRLRQTWRPPAGGDSVAGSPARVFVFGGSTVWGTGVRDDYTIPSCLARELTEAGHSVRVFNFGESGYVSTQEVITLLRCLQSGDVPDIAVFYNGVNDVFAAYQHREAGVPQNEKNRRAEFNLLKDYKRLGEAYLAAKPTSWPGFVRLATAIRTRLNPDDGVVLSRPASSGVHPDERQEELLLIDDLLRVYENNFRIVMAVSEAYGFDAVFYWQPMIFTKRHITPFEARSSEKMGYIKAFFLAAYQRVASSEFLNGDSRFRNLGGLFDDATKPYYIDFCHLAENGNVVVAETIVGGVSRILERRRAGARRVPAGGGNR